MMKTDDTVWSQETEEYFSLQMFLVWIPLLSIQSGLSLSQFSGSLKWNKKFPPWSHPQVAKKWEEKVLISLTEKARYT